MSRFGFHLLSNAWLLLLIVPLVLFYFLKLKRTRQVIPSLYLWRQVIRDNRVNSPFQRLKRNLLLLLQILLLLLAVSAATQPYWLGRPSRLRRLPILIDCSASMGAKDADGKSRLDLAKAEARKQIDGMLPGQELCLIAFSRTARLLEGFTGNRRLLLAALDRLAVEDVPSSIEAPLRMAQAMARTADFDEVLLYSDGNFPPRADFELSFKVDYQRLRPAGANLGITAFNATRSREGDWAIFISVEGSSDADGAARLVIRQGGEEVAKERLSVAKGQAERVALHIRGERAASLTATLEPDSFDSLAADNVAYLDLPTSRPLRVFASPTLATYRHALRAIPSIQVSPPDREGEAPVEPRRPKGDGSAGASPSQEGAAPTGSFDLAITDREPDLGIDARVFFTVGILPHDLRSLATKDPKGTEIVDWRRTSELLQHVELSELVILDSMRSSEGVSPGDYEKLDYDILAYGQRGPLLLERRRGPSIAYHLLFHSDRSTLPYRVAFPILVTNVVQMAMAQAGLAKAEGAHTGVLPPVPLKPARTYSIEGPTGPSRQEQADENGLLAGISAPRVGRYRILEGDAERLSIGASLLSPSESRLASVEQLQFNEDLSVRASGRPPRADRTFWWTLAFLGFFVLLGEWWYFNRKPGGPSS